MVARLRHFVVMTATLAGVVLPALPAPAVTQSPQAVSRACDTALEIDPLDAGSNVDVNGDLHSDLLVGMPGADHGAGAVEVRDSFDSSKVKVLAQGHGGIPGPRRAGGGFGSSVSAGELNQNPCDDLAIGIPNLTVHGRKRAGGVQVMFATSLGFVAGPLITRAFPGVPGSPQTNEHFGYAVDIATAQTMIDDRVTILIGIPGASVPRLSGAAARGAGEVLQLSYGLHNANRVSALTAMAFYQGHGVKGHPVTGAHLGMAVGFAGPGPAVGAPDETVHGKPGAGFWGSLEHAVGSEPPFAAFYGTSPGEHLGASISFGIGPTSVAGGPIVGAPGRTVGGHRGAGAIVMYDYDPREQTPVVRVRTVSQNSPHVPGRAATNAHFGATVSDATFDDALDVAIAVPGQTVDRQRQAGAVVMLHLLRGAVGDAMTYMELDQGTSGVAGNPEANDHFGATLTFAERWEGAKHGDLTTLLLVGDPGENIGSAINCGALEVFHFTKRGLAAHGSHLVGRKHPVSGTRYGGGVLSGAGGD